MNIFEASKADGDLLDAGISTATSSASAPSSVGLRSPRTTGFIVLRQLFTLAVVALSLVGRSAQISVAEKQLLGRQLGQLGQLPQQLEELQFSLDDESRCDRMVRRVSEAERRRVKRPRVNEHLEGRWVSKECEVRPGPEFLLRRYEFGNLPKHIQNNSSTPVRRFNLTQFFYSDRHCRRPLYSVTAWGRLDRENDSWLVPGATEMRVNVDKVDLVPYTKRAARELATRATQSCPGYIKPKWEPMHEYTVFMNDEYDHGNLVGDRNTTTVDPRSDVGFSSASMVCLEQLQVTFNELQLMQIESRPRFTASKSASASAKWVPVSSESAVSAATSTRRTPRLRKWKTDLLLGDIHTQTGMRKRYRPTAFQPYGLRKDTQMYGCKPCYRVARASRRPALGLARPPPRLRPRPYLPVSPAGEWISRRCETRPNTMFLMRRLSFFPNRDWQGQYSYYSDNKCSKPVFTIRAKGRYLQTGLSRHVDGGTNFNFKIKQLVLTPLSQYLANQLNFVPPGSCGRKGAWRRDVSQDITPTRGCRGLGLVVPLLEPDLLKMEVASHGGAGGRGLLLYLGQTPTDNEAGAAAAANFSVSGGAAPRWRPTSYQPPLLQCHSQPGYHLVSNEILPLPMAARRRMRAAAAEKTHISRFHWLLALGVVTVADKMYKSNMHV